MTVVLKPPFYVISDTHWYHRNITKYADRPYDHEVMMVKRWRNVVSENDTVLHLGDLFFGGREGFEKFQTEITPQLTGRKFLILGNHDKKKTDYEALGFTVIDPFWINYRGYKVSFAHYPKLLNEAKREKAIHVHGHIHVNGYARGEATRYGNINVSVEVMEYKPHRVTRLLNNEIVQRNSKKRYTNSRHYRCQSAKRQRRRAA